MQNAAATEKRSRFGYSFDLASAFSRLEQGNYEKVVSYLFRLGPPKDLGD